MENRVGSNIPSAAEIARLVREIDGIATRLAAYTIDLTPEGRHRALKFRPRGERIVQLVGELATDHEVSLPSISVADMHADLELAERLVPLANALAVVSQTIADTILQAHAECWWAATAFYTTLSRLSGANPRLLAALRPATEFFALGKRPPKPASGNGGAATPA